MLVGLSETAVNCCSDPRDRARINRAVDTCYLRFRSNNAGQPGRVGSSWAMSSADIKKAAANLPRKVRTRA